MPYTHALKLLAVPAEEREEFAAEHHVEELSSRELDRLIRERDEAVKRAEEAEEKELRQADDLARLRELENQVETQEQMAAEGRAAIRQMEEKVAQAQEALKQEKKKAREKADLLEKELEEARANPEVPQEVLDKLREEAGKASAAAVEQAKAETEQARADLARAQKELSMADGDMAVFKELFRRVQEDFGLMDAAIRRIGEKSTESAEKLRGAVRALLDRWTA